MPTPITLSTERLILRPWTEADFAPYAAINADPRVMEHFDATRTRAESDAGAQRIKNRIEGRGWGLWALELRETGDFIGFTGLDAVDHEAHFTPAVEIGWRIAHAHWGKGLAPEAARAALVFGFESLGLAEIVALTATMNRNSMRVMEKIGMTRDPSDDFEHPGLPEGHRLRPHVLYRLKA